MISFKHLKKKKNKNLVESIYEIPNLIDFFFLVQDKYSTLV